jgi:hypothetical protein
LTLGTAVAVGLGGTLVAVGGMAVDVGGTSVDVAVGLGGTLVAVEGRSVAVGGAAVATACAAAWVGAGCGADTTAPRLAWTTDGGAPGAVAGALAV